MKLGNTNVEIKATANYSKRTFTIRKVTTDLYTGAIFKAKYRTEPMTQDDFDIHLSSTTMDWIQFIKRSPCYYSVD